MVGCEEEWEFLRESDERKNEINENGGNRSLKRICIIERIGIIIIGEEDIKGERKNEMKELVEIEIKEERIGESNRNMKKDIMRNIGGNEDGLIGERRIKEIEIEIGEEGIGKIGGLEILRKEIEEGEKIGVNGKIEIRSKENNRKGGGRKFLKRECIKGKEMRKDIMRKKKEKMVGWEIEEIGREKEKDWDEWRSVERDEERNLGRRKNEDVEKIGELGVDEVNREFYDEIGLKK